MGLNNPGRFRQQGFSLIELLMVFVMIGILVAIAVPIVIGSRRTANQASAINSLRTYHSAQMSFNGGKLFLDNFQTLKEKTNGIDDVLGAKPNYVIKSGYFFTIGSGILPNTNPDFVKPVVVNGVIAFPAYYIQADPLIIEGITATGRDGYYIDYSGVIRVKTGALNADVTCPSLETGSR